MSSMLELIGQLVAVNILGALATPGSGESEVREAQAGALDAEIERRLALVKDFKSTEAVRIKMILDGGSDEGWRP